jgi:indolepyruvate decarboxylase
VSALVTTYGVGELSAIAGVAGAYAERVPIVCIVGTPPLGAIEERALPHHTLGDGNFANMLSSHRDFSVAQTRLEPANARWEVDRVLRSCWLEKRPVYLQLPSDVPAITIEAPEEPLQLAAPTSDPPQLVLAIEKIATGMAEAYAPAILLDADVARFGLTKPIIRLIQPTFRTLIVQYLWGVAPSGRASSLDRRRRSRLRATEGFAIAPASADQQIV